MKQKPSILIQIVHIKGPLRGEIQEFGGNQVTLGRHPDCDVAFPKDETLISRRHARIERDGNRFQLIDESTNGTFLNGKPVSKAQLSSGDVVTIGEGGPKISFLTQVGKAPAAAPPASEPAGTPLEPESEPPPRKKPVTAAPGAAPSFTPPPEDARQPAPSASPWGAPPAEEQPPKPPATGAPREIPVTPSQQPLVIQYGARLESFKALPVTLGRSDDCDFIIDHADLCQHHAQVFYHQDQYWIKDLSGRNLVLLNGEVIQAQAPLTPQARIALSPRGPNFSFLGGGRLAEITSPGTPSPDRETGKQSRTSSDKEARPGKLSSFVRRLKH